MNTKCQQHFFKIPQRAAFLMDIDTTMLFLVRIFPLQLILSTNAANLNMPEDRKKTKPKTIVPNG
jgi:hypothetical protein